LYLYKGLILNLQLLGGYGQERKIIQIVLRRQRSDTTWLANKKNVPPEPGIMFIKCDETPIQKADKVTQSLATFVKGKWTSEGCGKSHGRVQIFLSVPKFHHNVTIFCFFYHANTCLWMIMMEPKITIV
jgi:hypothetical protein